MGQSRDLQIGFVKVWTPLNLHPNSGSTLDWLKPR